MTDGPLPEPASLAWLTDWDAALAQARATRPLLIDVWKDP